MSDYKHTVMLYKTKEKDENGVPKYLTSPVKVGEKGFIVPTKLLQYAMHRYAGKELGTVMWYYEKAGFDAQQTFMKRVEKYITDALKHVTVQEMYEFIQKNDVEWMAREINKELDKPIDIWLVRIEPRRIFEAFLPLVYGMTDPLYVLNAMLKMRSDLYYALARYPGGFEWERNTCMVMRDKFGLNKEQILPYAVPLHEFLEIGQEAARRDAAYRRERERR